MKELQEAISEHQEGPKFQDLMRNAVDSGRVKISSRVKIADSFSALEFIVIEQVHMTVYAGDWEHKHLIIVGKDS